MSHGQPAKRARTIATFTQVYVAYYELQLAADVKPTVTQIRNAIGGGSRTTINRHLQSIRGVINGKVTPYIIEGLTTQQPIATTRYEDPTV